MAYRYESHAFTLCIYVERNDGYLTRLYALVQLKGPSGDLHDLYVYHERLVYRTVDTLPEISIMLDTLTKDHGSRTHRHLDCSSDRDKPRWYLSINTNKILRVEVGITKAGVISTVIHCRRRR